MPYKFNPFTANLDDVPEVVTGSFDLSYTGTLPTFLSPIYTVPPLRDALLGASGSQAAALRNGKWVSGINITGYGNPTIDNLVSLSSSDIVGIRDSFTLTNLSKLATVSFPVLATVGGSFTLVSITGSTFNGVNLSSVNFPALASVGGAFTINTGAFGGVGKLASVSFPALVSVGGLFTINASGQMSSLTSLNFPSLVYVGGFTGINAGSVNNLQTISFPSLTTIAGSAAIAGAALSNLISIDLPALANVLGNITFNSGFNTSSVLTNVNLSSLSSIGGSFNTVSGGGFLPSLVTISLPSLTSVGGTFSIVNGAATRLANFFIGSGLKHINGDFSMGTASLDAHNSWTANTYYPSYVSVTAPASAFSQNGTTVTVNLSNHGFQTNDLVAVSGLAGPQASSHSWNTTSTPATITRIDANRFSYTSTATSQIPLGNATIQRLQVGVTPVTKNGRKYICTSAGTSGATEPVWPTTVGNTVVDGTATWTCSEMSYPNLLSRLDALNGTNQTTTYGANRFINMVATGSTINSISTSAGVATITTAASHGITSGTQIFISGCTGTALRYNGIWTATSTGATTFTIPVPADLNGVAGAGTMRFSNSCPQYTGSTPIAAATITGSASDSHTIAATISLRDGDQGTPLPDFPAGNYTRNGNVNNFARYSCTENGWDIWYDTTSKRWINSPSSFTGNSAVIGEYLHSVQAVNISSTSSANPAVVTSSIAHGITTGAVFTVVIEGCSNNALNGSWTATSTGTTTFTIPVNGSGGATSNSGTVANLNQTYFQGRLMSGTITPVQGVLQTITTGSNHGFTSGDFVHFYGAVGTHATSINDSNASATNKSGTTAITVTNSTTFTCIRYATTQAFVGSYSLTTMPHMRRPSVNDVAYYATCKLRARGVATTVNGITGT